MYKNLKETPRARGITDRRERETESRGGGTGGARNGVRSVRIVRVTNVTKEEKGYYVL